MVFYLAVLDEKRNVAQASSLHLLLGSGIPLLSSISRHINLKLTGGMIYENGVVLLHYRVKN